MMVEIVTGEFPYVSYPRGLNAISYRVTAAFQELHRLDQSLGEVALGLIPSERMTLDTAHERLWSLRH
jgi:hypothetical protein